jgi:preprotein translocase subunit SecA
MINYSTLTNSIRTIMPLLRGTAMRDHAIVEEIRRHRRAIQALPNLSLEEETQKLRGPLISANERLISILALMTESIYRTLGLTLHDEQLLGGIVMSRESIAELQTGEGKTFVAALSAAYFALLGDGVHVMTVNSFLAERDFSLLQPAYGLLGLSIGLVDSQFDQHAKRIAYRRDITYGPGYEFGFDFLRDQVALLANKSKKLGADFKSRLTQTHNARFELVQRGHCAAVIDEADSVMIDEATTPLILSSASGKSASNAEVYVAADRVAANLTLGEDFAIESHGDVLRLTKLGFDRLFSGVFEVPEKGLTRGWASYVEQALKARHIYKANNQYIIDAKKELRIVDQLTGRIFSDRSWGDGLMQAVQAKEQIEITEETGALARITRQRYLLKYRHMCGMSGTVKLAEKEFLQIYRSDCHSIPTHLPCKRIVHPTRFFTSLDAKEQAIVADVRERNATGQPILLGTSSIESSQRIAEKLIAVGLKIQVLNGLQDAEEAAVVAGAGQFGMITVATGMAGRGTDIRLSPESKAVGGLHVIVSEPQESRRSDRQLIGRSARQGDPGSCQSFACPDDHVIRDYGQGLTEAMSNMPSVDGEIKSDLSAQIAQTQKRAENRQSAIRRQLFDKDDWLESVMDRLY